MPPTNADPSTSRVFCQKSFERTRVVTALNPKSIGFFVAFLLAPNVLGMTGANSSEMDPTTKSPVIDLMHDQRDVSHKAGTQRLGAFYAILDPDSKVHEVYGEPVVSERHRHRWELNAQWKSRFEAAGLRCSGLSPDRRLVEFVELRDHPYWVATQGHPEFKSRPDRAHPLFRGLIGAALSRRDQTPPALRRMLTEAAEVAEVAESAPLDTSS